MCPHPLNIGGYMKRYCLVIFILLFPVFQPVHAQVTGFLENFNDNTLTGWQVPQT